MSHYLENIPIIKIIYSKDIVLLIWKHICNLKGDGSGMRVLNLAKTIGGTSV